jgi:hypothetical protein
VLEALPKKLKKKLKYKKSEEYEVRLFQLTFLFFTYPSAAKTEY